MSHVSRSAHIADLIDDLTVALIGRWRCVLSVFGVIEQDFCAFLHTHRASFGCRFS